MVLRLFLRALAHVVFFASTPCLLTNGLLDSVSIFRRLLEIHYF
jgi:hypothetical protein